MTTFQVRYRNRVLDINPAELIRRVNAYWYRWELPGCVKACEYVRIPWYTDLNYCYPQPCTALTIWRPTLEVTPEMLWRKGDGGIKLVECAHVNVVLTLPEAA